MKKRIMIGLTFLISQFLYCESFVGVWGALGNVNYKSGDRSYLIVAEIGGRYLVIHNKLYDQGNNQWGGFSGFTGIGNDGTDLDGNKGLVIDVDNSTSDYFLKFEDWGDHKDILILDFAHSHANTPDGNLGMFSRLQYGELNAFGVLNSDNVNYRVTPLINGQIKGQIDSGVRIRLLQRTAEKIEIADMNDYWYEFAGLEDDVYGWIYGNFIDIEYEEIRRDQSPGYSY